MALDNFRTQKIIWDRANKKIFETIEANSGDSNGRKLVVQIINREATEGLSGTTLSLGWKSRKGAKGLDAFNVVDVSKGVFEIYYTTEMLSNIGDIEASLILIDSTGRIESSTFTISVTPSTVDDESVESENSFTALTEALVKVNDLEDNYAPRLNEVTAQLAEVAINVKSFGAIGDGVADDTDAFLTLSSHLNTLKSGFKLLIPKGTYRIGKQTHTDGIYPYYKSIGDILSLSGCSNFEIECKGTLLYNDGLRFGSFNPNTGEVHNAPSGGFTNADYKAQVDTLLNLTNCTNFKVNGVIADGNMNNMIVGGYWGDTGIQATHVGIRLKDCNQYEITHSRLENFGLDGVYVAGGVNCSGELFDVIATKSGRQGLSITECQSNLVVRKCQFNETGKGRVKTSPSCGVDIESNGLPTKNITFYDCDFYNNSSQDLLILNEEQTEDIRFYNCNFKSDDGSGSIWDRSNGSEFYNCNIGSTVNVSEKSIFIRCKFKVSRKADGTIVPQNLVLDTSSNTVFEDCDFYGESNVDNFYLSDCRVKRCKFHFMIPSLLDKKRVGVFNDVTFEECEFIEYNDGTYAIKTSGNLAYVLFNNPTYKGNTKWFTESIGYNSVLGEIKRVLGNESTNFNYQSIQTITVSGMSDTTSFSTVYLPKGSYLLQVYKGNGKELYRHFSATGIVNSSVSAGSSGNYHSGVILSQNKAAPATLSLESDGGGVKLKFSPLTGASALNGEEFKIALIPLRPFIVNL